MKKILRKTFLMYTKLLRNYVKLPKSTFGYLKSRNFVLVNQSGTGSKEKRIYILYR